MIHCGESKKDWKRLHERLRRVEYLPDSEIGAECGLEEYSAVLVDEAHLLEPGARELLAGISTRRPVIFSGDCEDVISPDELGESAEMVWKSVPGVQTFRMTNRIRTNAELSVFIQNMMRLTRGKGRRMYPHVSAGKAGHTEFVFREGCSHIVLIVIPDNCVDQFHIASILSASYFKDCGERRKDVTYSTNNISAKAWCLFCSESVRAFTYCLDAVYHIFSLITINIALIFCLVYIIK